MRAVLNGYLRQHGELILFENLRKGGALLFQDAEIMLPPLMNGGDIFDYARNVAGDNDNDLRNFTRDLLDFYIAASDCGVVKLKDGDWTRCPRQRMTNDSQSSERALSTPTSNEVTAMKAFYSATGLCSELHLDLASACTEQCIHCYVPGGRRDYLQYEQTEKLLKEFRAQQGLTVELTGGECMMHPDFDRICRLCRELDLNFIVMSNLTLCDDDKVAVLKETDPQFVNVSVYSMDSAIHDAITQIPGSWRRTMDAIARCEKAGIQLRFAAPLLKANRDSFPDLKKFAADHNAHLVVDSDIVPRCNGDCGNLECACTAEEAGCVLSADRQLWNRGYPIAENTGPNDQVCDIGRILYVNAKGEYYPCSGMNDYVIGTVRDNTVSEVWHGGKLERFRQLRNRDFPTCSNCEHRGFCKVCPACNMIATGDMFKPLKSKCELAAVKHKIYGVK